MDAPQPATPDASLGDRVGRYELRERLGAGGMGIVYAAWDPELDRRIAIKFIRRSNAVSPELLRRRLRREAQAMARLRHPNVVTVYDVGEVEGRLFVAMEFVDGVSLRKWLQTKPRTVTEILAVFRAAGEGLAAAHAEGVIHRDFKPDNVLVANDGKVLVLDFGLASWATTPGSDPGSDSAESSDESLRAVVDASPASSSSTLEETSLTRPGVVLGTLNYMAPEQRRGQTIDARTDQYSFCVALWQALSGELPYGGSSSRALARARLGRLGKLDRQVPARVERALRRGLAWSPDDRWPSMRALLDALAEPNHRRWWWLAIPAALAIGAVSVLLSRDDAPAAAVRSCDEQSERVAAVWNPSIADELAGVIAGRGEFAEHSWPYLKADLERWLDRWVEVDRELCERYGLGTTPELHQLQLLCLDRQLEHFELAADLLATATAEELEHGSDLLARLPDPAQCRDAAAGVVAPGVDPAKLAELEVAVARAELEYELGRLAVADTSSAELLATTDVTGLEELRVRVAELRGDVLVKLERREEAVDLGFSGLSAAERNGHAALRLRAFVNLVSIHVNTQDLAGAKRWLTQAQAIAAEQEFERELLRELASSEAWVMAIDGRLEQAIEAFDRAIALADPVKDRLERAHAIVARAQLFGWLGKPEQAIDEFVIGERELVQILGPEHPEVLDLRNSRAQIHMQLGQSEVARAEFLAVADSFDALRGKPSLASLVARSHAAWLLDRLGDCAGGLAELEPLIPLAREHMPYPSPSLGRVLTERAQLCGHKTPEAVAYAREVLALYREAVGDQHVIVADAHRLLARIHYENGEFEPAREEVDAALAIFAAVAPIGAERVPDVQALAMLIRHALGEPGALDGVEGVLATLGESHVLAKRLAELR